MGTATTAVRKLFWCNEDASHICLGLGLKFWGEGQKEMALVQ